jgi:hypothetical protein
LLTAVFRHTTCLSFCFWSWFSPCSHFSSPSPVQLFTWWIVCMIVLWTKNPPPQPPQPPKPKPQPPKPPPNHANARYVGTAYTIVDRPAAAINATATVVVLFIILKTDITFLCICRMLHSNC